MKESEIAIFGRFPKRAFVHYTNATTFPRDGRHEYIRLDLHTALESRYEELRRLAEAVSDADDDWSDLAPGLRALRNFLATEKEG